MGKLLTLYLLQCAVAFVLLVGFAIPVLRERTRHRWIYLVALITVCLLYTSRCV